MDEEILFDPQSHMGSIYESLSLATMGRAHGPVLKFYNIWPQYIVFFLFFYLST